MPNRIIKESICVSETINQLSPEVESFFYRLIVQCDDYGRFDARPAIIRSRCYPLRLEQITDSQIINWLNKLDECDLIKLYKADDKQYLLITTWEKHQEIRNHRSKYPSPPENIQGPREHPLPDESDIEDLFFASLSEQKEFNSQKIVSVSRQVRIKESYLDIVVKTDIDTYVFELKRNRLSNKSIEQLQGYLALINGKGILVGRGLAVNFNLTQNNGQDIAVINFNEDTLSLDFVNKPTWLASWDLTLSNVKSRYAMLAPNPNPIQSNPNPNPNPNPLSENGKGEKVSSISDVAVNLANKLKSLILRNNPKAKTPENLSKWASEFDRMLRRDHRPREDIEAVIQFSQDDSFWHTNILSAAKLREKYDSLYLKMKEQEKHVNASRTSRGRENQDNDWRRTGFTDDDYRRGSTEGLG